MMRTRSSIVPVLSFSLPQARFSAQAPVRTSSIPELEIVDARQRLTGLP